VIPLVVIEVGGSGATAPYAAEMVAACTASLRQGRCVLAPGEPLARPPDAVARVTPVGSDGELRFEIEVTLRASGSTPETRSLRVLEFQAVDEPEERWRSIGIAIAGTAGELSSGDGAQSKTGRAPPVRRAEPDRERPFRIAGGMITGSGMESGRVRLGGWLDGAYHFARPGPYALVVGRYTSAPAGFSQGDGGPVEITSSWTSVGLGAGIAPGGVAGIGFRLQLAGLAERFDAAATDSSGEEVSSDDRWLPGWLVAAKAAWPETGFIGAQVGGELSSVTGATGVELEGETVSSSPTFKWGLFFGLELRP
jgi:hypothetical protein